MLNAEFHQKSKIQNPKSSSIQHSKFNIKKSTIPLPANPVLLSKIHPKFTIRLLLAPIHHSKSIIQNLTSPLSPLQPATAAAPPIHHSKSTIQNPKFSYPNSPCCRSCDTIQLRLRWHDPLPHPRIPNPLTLCSAPASPLFPQRPASGGSFR